MHREPYILIWVLFYYIQKVQYFWLKAILLCTVTLYFDLSVILLCIKSPIFLTVGYFIMHREPYILIWVLFYNTSKVQYFWLKAILLCTVTLYFDLSAILLYTESLNFWLRSILLCTVIIIFQSECYFTIHRKCNIFDWGLFNYVPWALYFDRSAILLYTESPIFSTERKVATHRKTYFSGSGRSC